MAIWQRMLKNYRELAELLDVVGLEYLKLRLLRSYYKYLIPNPFQLINLY